jgi:hypothetical protein
MDFIAGVIIGWLGNKLRAVLKWLLDFSWGWIWATPKIRCYAVSVAYCRILERLSEDIRNGKIHDPRAVEFVRRLHAWAQPRLRSWSDRVWDRPVPR